MANWYCDPSLPIAGSYNASPVAAGTTPTKPDEGDGKASGVAAKASGTITIGTNLNSGDTISFNGKTFTAGTDFTIGGSASATATNIAAAINALSTTTPWTVGNGYQFRDLFNACVSGAVVTVHTRIGSADWNAVAIATSSGGRATVSGFSGGASGAFGWLTNTGSLAWPSGTKAAATYGVLVAEPVGYVIANGDKVNVRTGNGSSGITLDLGSGGALTWTWLKRGTQSLPVAFSFDNGTIWTADAGLNSQLQVAYNVTASYTAWSLGFVTAPSSVTDGGVIINGKINSDGSRNFAVRHRMAGGGSGSGGQNFYGQSYSTIRNTEFSDGVVTVANDNWRFRIQGYNTRRPRFINCKYVSSLSWTMFGCFYGHSYEHALFEWIGGEIAFSGLSSAPAGTFIRIAAAARLSALFKGTKFTGIPVDSLLATSVSVDVTKYEIELVDCLGAENFKLLGSNSIIQTTDNTYGALRDWRITMSGIKGNGYMSDTASVHASWIPGQGFPYLNGIVEENQPASIRIEHSTNSAYIADSGVVIFDSAVYNADTSAAVKMITGNIACDDNLTFDTSEIAMHVQYQDSATGEMKYVTTLVDKVDAAALTAGSGWYPDNAGKTYLGAKNYNEYKFVATTPTTVKATSMLRVWMTVHKANTQTGRWIFVDPYLVVA